MAATALVFWLFTALVGLYMTGIAVDISRPVGQPAHTHWPSWLMAWHPFTATVFATMWIIYMNTYDGLMGWLCLATLLLVAALGDVLVVTWVKDRRAEKKAEGAHVPTVRDYVPRNTQGVVVQQPPGDVPVTELSERRIPVIAVWTHALTAGVTILLVLLSCLGLGH